MASLAERSDLFNILSFLDAESSKHCHIHFAVLSTLLTANTSYRVYFLRLSPQDDKSFSAIVALRQENVQDNNQKMQKIWNMVEWSHDETALISLYEKLDVIDWKKDVVFAFNNHYNPQQDIVKFFNDRDRLINHRVYSADRYVLDISVALQLQLSSLPDDVYITNLNRKHAQLIFDYWFFKNTTTVDDIADEIDQYPSAGLFLKANNQLVSWIMGHATMGMSRLYTLEGHRQKGYARLVTQHLIKRMAQSGYVPYVNVVLGNTISKGFFESLGFHAVCPMHAILSQPPTVS